ncbi:Histone acetyltransferase type B catalytic subunit [Fasciola hepatica]|uniref:histone acetyltransferase n=1 Tax=Fasciola hepatica TaxID=6192 RepID=A0A2H1CJY5_FASHE|nr:Histone acetyltransferase type B catalytic subunit [Fasciola hepatica]
MSAPVLKFVDEYRVDACEAISFKLIRTKEDFEHGCEFHPEFAHQIFGESEQIFGYRNLKVNIWYLSGSLKTYINVSYSSSIDKKYANGAAADDIFELLSHVYPYSYDRNLVDFAKHFHVEKFKPYGVLRHSYDCTKRSTGEKTGKYCVFFIEHGMKGFDDFIKYHKKMESFLLFFLDGASAITTDDPQWCYYVLYEAVDVPGETEPQYAFLGYMTVYKFYAYPANLRPRLSQVVILPPFRNVGHATELLHAFYRDFIHVPNVCDITVEDPTDDFRRIRDFVDCKRCLQNKEIMETFRRAECSASTDANVSQSKPDYQLFRDRVRKHLKISRCQAKRVFEILQLYLLPRTEDAVELYRKALHKRISTFYERSRTDTMCGRTVHRNHTKSDEEARRLIDKVAEQSYATQLDQQVTEDLGAYQVIVCKLDRDSRVSASN